MHAEENAGDRDVAFAVGFVLEDGLLLRRERRLHKSRLRLHGRRRLAERAIGFGGGHHGARLGFARSARTQSRRGLSSGLGCVRRRALRGTNASFEFCNPPRQAGVVALQLSHFAFKSRRFRLGLTKLGRLGFREPRRLAAEGGAPRTQEAGGTESRGEDAPRR